MRAAAPCLGGAALCWLAACCPAPSTPAPAPDEAPKLRLIGDTNLSSVAAAGSVPVGGLSDLCFREDAHLLLALSDGRAELGPARFYELSLALGPQSLAVGVVGTVEIRGSEGAFGGGSADPEGIALAPGGGLLIATEGDAAHEPREPPTLSKVTASGVFEAQLKVPPRFIPNPRGPQRLGVRDNMGFEGLTSAPSGRWVFMANEEALVQDGPEATRHGGTLVRIIRYDASLDPVAEHAYLTDAVPSPESGAEPGVMGVSALMALDDERLWVLERAGVPLDGMYSNHVRIYQVDIAAAPDVSSRARLRKTDAVAKALVLDMDDIAARLHPPRLDNFEGMALGPRLEDGERSVLLVSDDNFQRTQRTAFVAFAIEP